MSNVDSLEQVTDEMPASLRDGLRQEIHAAVRAAREEAGEMDRAMREYLHDRLAGGLSRRTVGAWLIISGTVVLGVGSVWAVIAL